MRTDVYEQITNQIVVELERGVRPWLKPWNAEHAVGRITRPLRSNGIPYQGINVLMLWSAAIEKGYAAPVWMTFKQALELKAHEVPSVGVHSPFILPLYDLFHHQSFQVSAMNNVIRDVGVFAIVAALTVFAFSIQARAMPPCTHPGFATPQKCNNNSICHWCGKFGGAGYCWWKARQCGK